MRNTPRRKAMNIPGHAHELTFSCYRGYRFLDVQVPGREKPAVVSVPIRPFTDQEFNSTVTLLLDGIIKNERKIPIAMGTYQPLTPEQKRVFKLRYPKRTLDVDVPPYMVWSNELKDATDAERAAIKLAVENEYRRLRSTLSKKTRAQQQQNDFQRRNGILPPE